MNENSISSKLPAWQIHKRLYNWVLHWADTRFGLLALIILAVTEPICVPVPADILVVGMSLGKPKNGIKYGLLCSMFSILGGTIAFALGLAIGGENVAAFLDKIHLGSKVTLALEMYQKYDFWAIAIAALTPVPYMLFSWLGGLADVSIVKFILVSIVFRSMRFGSEGILFYFVGAKAKHFIEKHFNTASVIVIILLALVVFLIKKIGTFFAG
jgi:membrane protein YqaA with SNARE-associated domain